MAHIVIYTNLPDVGGHSTIVLELARSFTARGANVTLLTRNLPEHGYSDATHNLLLELGVEVIRIDLGSRTERLRRVCRAIWRPGIVAFISIGMRYVSIPLALLVRTRNTLYYHITHEAGAGGLKLLRSFHRFYRHLVVISLETQLAAKGERWQSKLVWLPQIVRLSPPRGPTPAVRGAGGRNFGFLGRFVDYKGIVELLELWPANSGTAYLHLMGDGPLRERVLNLVRSDSRFAYHGSFSAAAKDRALAEFFGRIDTLIVPTKGEGEGLPTVILEAWSFGIPVIATCTGGMRMFRQFSATELQSVIELVEVESLAGCIAANAARPAPDQQTAEKCTTFVDQHFNPDDLANRWYELCSPSAHPPK